jgi:hypothetical protein
MQWQWDPTSNTIHNPADTTNFLSLNGYNLSIDPSTLSLYHPNHPDIFYQYIIESGEVQQVYQIQPETSATIYVDPETHLIHPNGIPFMCFWQPHDKSKILVIPCEPCAIGTGTFNACDNYPLQNDPAIFQAPLHYFSILNPRKNLIPIYSKCANVQSQQLAYDALSPLSTPSSLSHCNPCLLANSLNSITQHHCNNASGVHIFMCAANPAGSIYSIATSTNISALQQNANVSGFAAIQSFNDTTILAGGYAHKHLPTKGIYTKSIITQNPRASQASQAPQAPYFAQTWNISSLTNIAHAGYAFNPIISAPPPNWDIFKLISIIFLSTTIAIIFTIYIGLLYRNSYTISILLSLKNNIPQQSPQSPPSLSSPTKKTL